MLHVLVQSVQFKKHEKHPWRSATLLHGYFSRFLNCTDGPNHETHHNELVINITYTHHIQNKKATKLKNMYK